MMPLPPDYLTGKPVEIIDLTSRTASAAWKASAKKQKQRVAELEKWIIQELDRRAELEEALEVIRDLARTGLAPDILHYKVNRVAGIANVALNKDREV